MPMIHVYGFSKAEDPEHDFNERINVALRENVDSVEMHRIIEMVCRSFDYMGHKEKALD
jgi:hypothetical protein